MKHFAARICLIAAMALVASAHGAFANHVVIKLGDFSTLRSLPSDNAAAQFIEQGLKVSPPARDLSKAFIGAPSRGNPNSAANFAEQILTIEPD